MAKSSSQRFSVASLTAFLIGEFPYTLQCHYFHLLLVLLHHEHVLEEGAGHNTRMLEKYVSLNIHTEEETNVKCWS